MGFGFSASAYSLTITSMLPEVYKEVESKKNFLKRSFALVSILDASA